MMLVRVCSFSFSLTSFFIFFPAEIVHALTGRGFRWQSMAWSPEAGMAGLRNPLNLRSLKSFDGVEEFRWDFSWGSKDLMLQTSACTKMSAASRRRTSLRKLFLLEA